MIFIDKLISFSYSIMTGKRKENNVDFAKKRKGESGVTFTFSLVPLDWGLVQLSYNNNVN